MKRQPPSDRLKSLAPGDRVGPYEILVALGAGGMGEVYRAYDGTLGREVAIKVLTGQSASDPGRLGRFDREGRILASLNHPNIATIHGVVESPSGPALILELVEGLTLEDRLATGALPLAETLAFARQLAEALEAAHEQGVVHRDLKPANIKVRPDGALKVLDFGIAKMLESEAMAPAGATVSATAPGMLIGTIYYMSPEQARGEAVTRRSDVWAFGAILYEMLMGKRAFSGPTKSDVLAAILQGSPDWSALPPSTPPGIVRLVRRCLERNPKARLHDIGDARLDIEDEERVLRGEAPIHGQRGARGGRWNSRWWLIGLAAILALAIVAAVFALARRSPEAPQEVRLQMAPPRGTQFVSVPAISPDGRTIAFVAATDHGRPGRMWIRPLAAAAASEIPGTDGAIFPFWSADGRSIAFFADRKLKRVPASGGNPVVVCDAEAGRGGVWLDDDTIVFAPTPFSPLVRVSAAGGTPAPMTSLAADETGHRFPERLPGGYLLYYVTNQVGARSGTRFISIDAPDRALNFLRDAGVGYVSGFLIFVRSAGGYPSVLAQPLKLPDGQLTGEPVELGRTRISEVSGRFVAATSLSGVIAILGPIEGVGQLTWVSREGRVLDTVGDAATQLGVELSPDARQVATMRGPEIWSMSLDRPVPNRVVRGAHPTWSPDGTRILSLYQQRGIGTFDLAVTTLSTGSVETVFTTGPEPGRTTGVVKPFGWLRDGRTLVWMNGTAKSLWTMPVGEKREAVELLNDGSEKPEARLSPDGRWIAYSTDRSGRFEVEVRSFPDAGPAYPVSIAGGGYPRWRADGRELYFVSPASRIMAVTFAPGTPPSLGKPEELFEVRLPTHPNRFQFAGYGYDVSADGSRFLVNRLVSDPEISMSVIAGWRPQ